jgi:RNA polymerase sigma factor (sigma-70 family)
MELKNDILLFSEGDNAVLSIFYSRWKAELYLVAYNYCRNSEDAEDAVSECFAKLLQTSMQQRKVKFVENNIDIKALLLVMVRNRCLDEIKQKNNRQRIMGSILHLFNTTTRNKSYDKIDNESFKNLCTCIPEKERVILLLNIDGYSHQEIALQIGISEKTVSNNLTLARKKIKELWDDFMN